MSGKIIGFFGIVVAILVFVIAYKQYRINALGAKNNALKSEVCERDEIINQKNTYIKEMEKINEAYKQAEKESQQFKEELLVDGSDNLDVVPATYILDRLRAD